MAVAASVCGFLCSPPMLRCWHLGSHADFITTSVSHWGPSGFSSGHIPCCSSLALGNPTAVSFLSLSNSYKRMLWSRASPCLISHNGRFLSAFGNSLSIDPIHDWTQYNVFLLFIRLNTLLCSLTIIQRTLFCLLHMGLGRAVFFRVKVDIDLLITYSSLLLIIWWRNHRTNVHSLARVEKLKSSSHSQNTSYRIINHVIQQYSSPFLVACIL